MHKPATAIRNVVLLGHRGSGKTSLFEALLYEAAKISRLGSVEQGTTVSDSDADEKARQMSIRACIGSLEWEDRKINLIDTPGEPSFLAETLAALSVCEVAVMVVNSVMGVEITTQRLWQRCDELDIPRLVFVSMLDRERGDYFRTLDSLRERFGTHVVPVDIPVGVEHNLSGVVDLVDLQAFEYANADRGSGKPIDMPDDLRDRAESYREQLMDSVAENDDDLMERYLEGEEISHDETIKALEQGVAAGTIFPVACGVATRNLGIDRLLDALVDDLPSPVEKGAVALSEGDAETTIEPDEDGSVVSYAFKTLTDSYTGRINLIKVLSGVLKGDSQLVNTRTRDKERLGQLLAPSGKKMESVSECGPGDICAVAKLKTTKAGDILADKDRPLKAPGLPLPAPVMAFAMEPKSRGDEDKVSAAMHRLREEDPSLDVHRDPQTGEQIVAGLSQLHVEVTVDRIRERFGAEVELKPPTIPYRETVKATAKAQGRYKKQTGGRGQFGDCHIELSSLPRGEGFKFVNEIKGGVIPSGFIPAVEKGIVEAMQHGEVAGYPVADVQVRLYDGSYHSVDSSEMAFKIAGSLAFKKAMKDAQPVLLEPIMLVAVIVPEDSVGDVIGDLNGRRGRPLGMEPSGGLTEVKAEAPMAELLNYAPQLRSMTAGRGEYTMEFQRYEEVPSHLAANVAAEAKVEAA